MKAWQIFIHSVRQVFGNFNDALRISGLIFIVQMMMVLIVAPEIVEGAPIKDPIAIPGLLAVVVIGVIGSFWIAVSWHRFVLGNERGRTFVPPFHGGLIWGYFWRSLIIGLMMVLIAVVIGMLATLVVVPMAKGSWVGVALLVLIMVVPVLTVFYRFGTVLPGAALGREVSLSDGWAATTGATGTIALLAMISGAATVLLDAPNFWLPAGSIPALLWGVVAGWMQLMVGVSILTTLYGHYIEKRPLV
ncbi:MAG: hypothetical protein LBE86_06875 [Gemmobacter sp.]|jgi:hypothetical protein|nr:hypothetical protein [Gemmobacter sp.]